MFGKSAVIEVNRYDTYVTNKNIILLLQTLYSSYNDYIFINLPLIYWPRGIVETRSKRKEKSSDGNNGSFKK